jgi:hypothetical protein
MGEGPMLRQREPRQYNERHLQFIRSQPCCICGDTVSVEAAHLRVGSINDDKPHTGMGEKPSDSKWVLPLCKRHHDMQHSMNESEFWASFGIDPFALAMHYQMRPR